MAALEPRLKKYADQQRFSFPPLVLHGDPLAAALISRRPSEHALRAAIMLNKTRFSTILTSWFPSGDGLVSKVEFISVLTALGLHLEGDIAGEALFDKHLDAGNGLTSVHTILEFVLGPEAFKVRRTWMKRREPRLVLDLPTLPAVGGAMPPDGEGAYGPNEQAPKRGERTESYARGRCYRRCLSSSSSAPTIARQVQRGHHGTTTQPPPPSSGPRTATQALLGSLPRPIDDDPASAAPHPDQPRCRPPADVVVATTSYAVLDVKVDESNPLATHLELRVVEGTDVAGARSTHEDSEPVISTAVSSAVESQDNPLPDRPAASLSPAVHLSRPVCALSQTWEPQGHVEGHVQGHVPPLGSLPDAPPTAPTMSLTSSAAKRPTTTPAHSRSHGRARARARTHAVTSPSAGAEQAARQSAPPVPRRLPRPLPRVGGLITLDEVSQAPCQAPRADKASSSGSSGRTAKPLAGTTTSLAAAAADTGWKKARGIGGLLGTLANAAQADKALDHVATPEQVADLLVAVR